MAYPVGKPFDEGFIQVSDIHKLHYGQLGNPNGKPAVFLHGGPGGEAKPEDVRYFNLDVYRVVYFSQRGCGKSEPHASLVDNTTWDLVADIEKIREHLGIEKWLVFGGSWGSTLSLAYSQTHPERCTELVLRGIFLLRRAELEFFYHGGSGWIWPKEFQAFSEHIPEEERSDLMAAYYKRLTSDDDEVSLKAATAWSLWEESTCHLYQNAETISKVEDARWARAFARIECHYFVNGGWFPDGHLISEAQIAKIRHIPCIVVQGRYDTVCPSKSAWDLKQAWGEGLDLQFVDDAGHSAKEPGITKLLAAATDKFAASWK